MASSQVEIASHSPFGYVLKDRNRHDRYRASESNAFQKNFNDLVQTHLNSCIAGHSRNSVPGPNGKMSHQMDYTDLWVHNPQSSIDENNHHSLNSEDGRISSHSDSSENCPHHHIGCTDLWVHNPQRNSNENNPKKSKASEKWDKARDMVFAFERKSQDKASSSGPVLASEKGRSQDAGSSMPASSSQIGGRCPDMASSPGPVSNSQRGRSHDLISLRPVELSQREKSQERLQSGLDLRSQRENSPVQSESSVEVQSLGGVSSLVQKWRDFEAEARCFSATNSPVCSSRSNSGSFFLDNSSFADAPIKGSDVCEEFFDLRPATPSKNEDLFVDWESDQTGKSGPPSSQGRDSDATESERTRVADIIRKLTSNGDDHNDAVNHVSLPFVRTSLDKSEQRVFSPVSSSPRIRGRQAFTDLLMQMERDRHRELERLVASKAVSKFSHRGRIQAMLRIKFLRRVAEGKDGRNVNSTSSESNRLTQSAIMHIRERFKAGVNQCGKDLRSQQGEVVNKTLEGEKFGKTYQQIKENNQQELMESTKPAKAVACNYVDAEDPVRKNQDVATNHHVSTTMVHQNALQVQRSEVLHQEKNSSSDVIIQKGTSSESSTHGKPEFTSTSTSIKIFEKYKYSELEESNNQHHTESSNEFTGVNAKAQGDWDEEEDAPQNLVVSDCSQASDVSNPFSGWEDLQDDYQQQVEINQDWISDVSRPRSTWEDLRQARYQEMLDPFVENEDIRQLLNRKSVSNFLSSGLRESIDRLMMSRIQHQPSPLANRKRQEDKPDQVKEVEAAKKVEIHEAAAEEYEEPEERGAEDEEENESGNQKNDCEEDEEDEFQIGQEYNQSQDYVQQNSSWDQNQDHEVSDNYYDLSAFPSPQQSFSSTSSSPETQPSSSFTNHPSIEMEFIYELRGNMEQLHQEISELRRSIKSCVNMQMKLQESIMQDGTIASCHSGRKKRRDSSLGKKSSRGRCCICYEMQIDSLLYRCGHMCTCFKCAHDLQWGSGKCPICQAPIIDIVRAYSYA